MFLIIKNILSDIIYMYKNLFYYKNVKVQLQTEINNVSFHLFIFSELVWVCVCVWLCHVVWAGWK